MQNNNLCQSIICYSSPSGSPAEKADLEVADEILEVNGESLENSNHTDVIAHIHNVRFSDDLTTTLQKKQNWYILQKGSYIKIFQKLSSFPNTENICYE